MQNRFAFRRLAARLAVGLAFALAGASGAAAQTPPIQEVEPNHPCTSAQDLTSAALPVAVAGSLDTPPATPDVDFYRFSAPAGSVVAIRHTAAGARPLADPYLGILQSDCATFLAVNDDLGPGNLNSLARVTVPADGVIVVAATSWHDWSFSTGGNSSGTYLVTVEREILGDSISGRVVNARTGAVVNDAYIYLRRCVGGSCEEHVGDTYTEADGTFTFQSGDWRLRGNLLQAGEYQVALFGAHYEDSTFGPFTLGEGEALQLGDVPITPLPVVGSIRGRAVDGITGAPLSGTAVPHASAELLFCSPGTFYCYTVRYGQVDAQGVFRFESTATSPIHGGEYRVLIRADQYQPTESERFTVGDGQHFDVGDVGVKSFPVRVNLVQGCNALPATGGTCRFTVNLANGNTDRLDGEAWSIVRASGIEGPAFYTTFQVGGQRAVSLPPGASANLDFSFTVPAAVENGAFICVRGFAGQRPHNFETLGSHDLFCLWKGIDGFGLVPEAHKREVVRAQQSGGSRK